jgi:hypothetical protein
MLYHGPVRVPDNARPGSARIRVELPKKCDYSSVATDIAVKLVKNSPGVK